VFTLLFYFKEGQGEKELNLICNDCYAKEPWKMTRERFMEAYRHDEALHEALTDEDRFEIWRSILMTRGDINYENIMELIRGYGIQKDIDFMILKKELVK
jgi:hypothetical protein